MSMTKIQAVALAHFVRTLRDGWDFHGIVHALGQHADKGTAADLAIAMITAASTDADLPAGVVNPVYWPTWGPKAEEERDARYRADIEAARFRRLKGEADQAAAVAATPEQIRAIRNQRLSGGTA